MFFYVFDILRSAFNDQGFFEFRSRKRKNWGDIPQCPRCGTNLGPKPWLPPYDVSYKGKRVGDVCFDGTGHEFLISEPFRKAWEDSGFSGMSVLNEPVTASMNQKASKGVIGNYYVAKPTIAFTHLDEKGSGLEIAQMVGCDLCRVARRAKLDRLIIDESTWAGEDIFYPTGLFGVLVVTQQFSNLIERNRFTNIFLVPQDRYHYEEK